MIIVTPSEFRQNQAKMFDLAKTERVLIKRRNQFIELVSREYIIPDTISPSGDPFFDNPLNVEKILKAEEEVKEGKVTRLTDDLMKELFEGYEI